MASKLRMRIRIGSARALKQPAYSFARDSVILADFVSGQQLAVRHFVVAGTAVSTTTVPDSSKNVNEAESRPDWQTRCFQEPTPRFRQFVHEVSLIILTKPGAPHSRLRSGPASLASIDQRPPPTEMRKIKQQNMAKSVRASLTMYQKPWLARNNSGIFVVAIAVVMTMNRGMDASLVHNPIKSRNPHRISKVPTK